MYVPCEEVTLAQMSCLHCKPRTQLCQEGALLAVQTLWAAAYPQESRRGCVQPGAELSPPALPGHAEHRTLLRDQFLPAREGRDAPPCRETANCRQHPGMDPSGCEVREGSEETTFRSAVAPVAGHRSEQKPSPWGAASVSLVQRRPAQDRRCFAR